MKLRTLVLAVSATMAMSANAQDPEYVMSCAELAADQNLELTAEARERFANLKGSCMGIVDRDGELYAHTQMVVRRVINNKVTLYIPATDSTIDVHPDASSRVDIGGTSVRPRDLIRGQELNLYLSVDKFTQAVPDEIVLPTEDGELVPVAAAPVAALPTTG